LERGIPLGQVKGTGPDGRIVKVSRGFLSQIRDLSVLDASLTPRRRMLKSTKAEEGDLEALLLRRQLQPLHPARQPPLAKLHQPLLQNTRIYPSAACVGRSGNG